MRERASIEARDIQDVCIGHFSEASQLPLHLSFTFI